MVDFELMQQVVDRIETAIEALTEQYNQKVVKSAEGLEGDELTNHYNDSADESMLLDGPVTEFARKAMLIAAYSQFEDSLKGLCKLAHKLGMNGNSIPQFGFSIKRSKEYLLNAKFGGQSFNCTAFGDEWDDVYDGWRLVRNNFVHDDGLLAPNHYIKDPATGEFVPVGDPAEDAQDIRDFVAKRSCIKLSGEQVELGRDAVPTLLRELEAAFNLIDQEFDRIAPEPPKERPR